VNGRSETASGAASVMVDADGSAKQGRGRSKSRRAEPCGPPGETRAGERRPQRREVGATARGRGRVLAGAQNDSSSQVYGAIWDVSMGGADARVASE